METAPSDAKPNAASSAAVGAPSPLTEGAASPPGQQAPLDVASEIAKKYGEANDGPPQEGEGGDDAPDGDPAKPGTQEEPAKPADEPKDESLPFHKHPRFQQLIKENQELRPVKAEIEALRPLAERMKVVDEFSAQYGVTPELHKQALEIAALSVVDRKGYVETLKKLLADAETRVGDRLPEDLAAEVENGVLSEERAKEIAQLRAGRQDAELGQQRLTEQTLAQRQQEVTQTLNAWGASKIAVDPDFKPKATAEAPDGKYEWMVKGLHYLLQTEGAKAKSVQDVVALAERAYKEANGLFSRKGGRTNKLLSSNGSSNNNNQPAFELKGDLSNLRELVYRTAGASR